MTKIGCKLYFSMGAIKVKHGGITKLKLENRKEEYDIE
jgi:hypothetical protein